MKRLITRWLLKLASKGDLLAYDLGGLAHESSVPALLYEEQWVGMIYLDVVEFELTEQIVGPSNCLRVLQSLESMARKEAPHLLKPYQLLEVRRWGDDLLIYFYSRTYPPPAAPDLANLASFVKDRLASGLNHKYSHLIPSPITFHVGYNLLKPEQNAEKTLYTAFKEAMMIAKRQLDAKEVERRLQFKEILAKKKHKNCLSTNSKFKHGRNIGLRGLKPRS